MPDVPDVMRVDAVTDTLIIFSWDAPRDFGSDVEVYEVCRDLFLALPKRLKFTVRRNKFNQDFLSCGAPKHHTLPRIADP